jgi:hypothetical protein
MSRDQNRDQINEKTSLPFKIVVPVITAMMIASWTANQKMNQIQAGIDQAWKASEQQRFVDKLRLHNPNLVIPSVEEIRWSRDREIGKAEIIP